MHPNSNNTKSVDFACAAGGESFPHRRQGVLVDGYPRPARFWMRLLADARSFRQLETRWQAPPGSPITWLAPPLPLKSKPIPAYSRISRRSTPATIWPIFS